MNAYMYQAALYCEDCGLAIAARIDKELRDKAGQQVNALAIKIENDFGLDPGKWPEFFKALENAAYKKIAYNMEDDGSYDSDEYPKGPFGDGGGKADCPQHCDACGEFLENPLTSDGYEYVTSYENERWDAFYDIDREVTQ